MTPAMDVLLLDVRQERDQLIVGDDAIRILHERTLDALPWRELGVDIVLDCTGVFGNREHGEAVARARTSRRIPAWWSWPR